MSNPTLHSTMALRPGLVPVVEDKQAPPPRPNLNGAENTSVAVPAAERRAIPPRTTTAGADARGKGNLSRSSIYHLIQDGHFPAPVAIGGQARAWIKHEVEGWVAQRIRASRPHP